MTFTPETVLSEALARYGLTPEDVPVLTREWGKRYKDLPERPKEPKDVLDEYLGNPNYGRHRGGPYLGQLIDGEFVDYDPENTTDDVLIMVHTRNGGGNREHYFCEEGGCTACATDALQDHPVYQHDADDDWDCTYANFYFRADSKVVATYTAAVAAQKSEVETIRKHEEIARVSCGSLTPWSVFAPQEKVGALHEEISQSVTPSYMLDTWNRNLARCEASLAELTGEVKGNTREANLGIGYRDVKRRYEQCAEIRALIPTLPESLRDYLDGDRGEGTYQTKEKVGRRNVTKTVKYQKQTDFQRDEENATHLYTRRSDEYSKRLKELTDERDRYLNQINEAKEKAIAAEQAEAELWALGWMDNVPVPSRPIKKES